MFAFCENVTGRRSFAKGGVEGLGAAARWPLKLLIGGGGGYNLI